MAGNRKRNIYLVVGGMVFILLRAMLLFQNEPKAKETSVDLRALKMHFDGVPCGVSYPKIRLTVCQQSLHQDVNKWYLMFFCTKHFLYTTQFPYSSFHSHACAVD